MEIRQLRYFLTVAETSNFTRAADRLHIAQSALSQQIAALEKSLSVQLFHRTSRTVSLTDAGRALVPFAQHSIDTVDRAKAEMDGYANLTRGTLHLGLIQTPVASVDIIAAMGELHKRHPGVAFHVSDGPSEQMVSSVVSGTLDVAVVGLDASECPGGVTCVQLSSEPLVAVVPADDALAERESVDIRELTDSHQFIHFTRGSGIRRRVESAFERAGTRPPEAFEVSQLINLVRLGAHGIGRTVVPRTAAVEARSAVDASFTTIPLTDTQAVHPVSVVYNPVKRSPATTAFLDILASDTTSSEHRQNDSQN